MITCPNCMGTGVIEGPKWAPYILWATKACPTCKGDGEVANKYSQWARCPQCEGWGKEPPLIRMRRCPVCNGVGVVLPSKA